MRVLRYGESAWFIEIDRVEPRIDARAAARARAALAEAYPEADVVSGAASVLIESTLTLDGAALARVVAGAGETTEVAQSEHVIDVIYDGPDLDRVAAASRLSRSEVVDIHRSVLYAVEVIGFLPGFAYLGEVDQRLRVPRLGTPRKVVPAGSVGIADRYTAVYPSASPGGWSLLGRTLNPSFFDPTRDPPTRLRVGDTVRFRAIEEGQSPVLGPPEGPSALVTSTSQSAPLAPPAIEILGASHATVQDLGRRMRARGIPRSGPLDEEFHRAANRAIGNWDTSATIEIPLDGLSFRALRRLTFSLDGEDPVEARAGETIRIAPTDRAVRYLAVQGGIDVPKVLGSRATLLSAGLGGFEGRRLRRGDRLLVGNETSPVENASASASTMAETTTLEIIPLALSLEPQPLDDLCRAVRTVSAASDRIGIRLDGPPVRRNDFAEGGPQPVLPGAVQITPDGTPIVLGPDCAVTGGYPVVGVITHQSRARLARIRPGGSLRFRST